MVVLCRRCAHEAHGAKSPCPFVWHLHGAMSTTPNVAGFRIKKFKYVFHGIVNFRLFHLPNALRAPLSKLINIFAIIYTRD